MTLTIQEQRGSLYAALLRHAAEAGPLRERTLDYLVLVSLDGTSEDRSLTVKQIQDQLQLAPGISRLRKELVEETLSRLISAARKVQAADRGRKFHLTATGRDDLRKAQVSLQGLFQPVLDEMLADIEPLVDRATGSDICRRFISTCFGDYGTQIARAIANPGSRRAGIDAIDVPRIVVRATKGLSLSEEATRSLEMRCLRFLNSPARHNEELKFWLTQAYFAVQLLGMDRKRLDPLAEEAFQDATLFLDTNVLMSQMSLETGSLDLHELTHVARDFRLHLVVTEATLGELQRATAGRLEDLKRILASLPAGVVRRTSSDLLKNFLSARDAQPDLTPESFLAGYGDIRTSLQLAGIVVQDESELQVPYAEDFTEECSLVDQAAEESRGWGKTAAVQRHDAYHWVLVKKLRAGGAKAWFLTTDRTLQRAAALADERIAFCLPLTGFIQGLSPFIEISGEHGDLVELFNAILSGDVKMLPGQSLFDLQELRVISELHEDVVGTPPEQLYLALDHVKTDLLHGRPFSAAEHQKAALALKKFLTSTVDERERALRDEVARVERERESERARRAASDRKAARARKHAKKLRAEGDRATGDARAREASFLRELRSTKAFLMTVGSLASFLLWRLDGELASSLATAPDVARVIAAGVRLVGAAVWIGAVTFATLGWHRSFRRVAVVLACALGAVGANVLNVQEVSRISGALTVGGLLSMTILAFLEYRGDRSRRS